MFVDFEKKYVWMWYVKEFMKVIEDFFYSLKIFEKLVSDIEKLLYDIRIKLQFQET